MSRGTSFRRLLAASGAVLIGLPALACDRQQPQENEVEQSSAEETRLASNGSSVIDQIQALEAQNDAKCHSTANRVEYYIFGTPLSEEARFEKVEQQKRLIRGLWEQASDRVTKTIPPESIVPLISQVLRYEIDDQGHARVTLKPEQEPITLSQTDLRHYGSIAYSLRAILSVQQDDDLAEKRALSPLSEEAVTALSRFVDVYTLTALSIADRISRDLDHKEVQKEDIVAAFTQIRQASQVASK